MRTMMLVLAIAIAITPAAALAADQSNDNGNKQDPKSSSAATPSTVKHSPGTVGAMKGAEGGSFTASPADQKKGSLESH